MPDLERFFHWVVHLIWCGSGLGLCTGFGAVFLFAGAGMGKILGLGGWGLTNLDELSRCLLLS